MYCLDTEFLIAYFKKRIAINDIIQKIFSNNVFITSLSIFELYYGIDKIKLKDEKFNYKKREKQIQDFLKNVLIINFDIKAAK